MSYFGAGFYGRGYYGAGYWGGVSTPPAPDLGDHNDPGYKRRRREPDWEAYRAEQRALRETLVDVYESATGKVKTAEQIIDMPKPPKRAAADIRPLIARIREIEAEEGAARAAWEADRRREQDDEDIYLILLLQ